MVKVKNNHCMVTETPEFSLWSDGQMENLYFGHGQNFLPFDHDNFEILDMITFKLKPNGQNIVVVLPSPQQHGLIIKVFKTQMFR